ncbi:MAG: nucleotidyltransferase domain-containing protein [Candidatus Poribacteria bacterium]
MDASLEKAVKIIVDEIKPDKILLFGSRARGDYIGESDYDLCIIKEGIEHRRKLVQKIYRLLYGSGIPVDIIVETPENFERLKDYSSLIYKEIAKNGKVLYERQRDT